MTTWHTPTTARQRWAGAPKEDAVLQELLDVAQHQVIEYGRVLAEGEPIPVSWPMAQVRQARALWETARAAGADDEIGLDGYQLRASADMSASIRRLIGTVRTPVVG